MFIIDKDVNLKSISKPTLIVNPLSSNDEYESDHFHKESYIKYYTTSKDFLILREILTICFLKIKNFSNTNLHFIMKRTFWIKLYHQIRQSLSFSRKISSRVMKPLTPTKNGGKCLGKLNIFRRKISSPCLVYLI